MYITQLPYIFQPDNSLTKSDYATGIISSLVLLLIAIGIVKLIWLAIDEDYDGAFAVFLKILTIPAVAVGTVIIAYVILDNPHELHELYRKILSKWHVPQMFRKNNGWSTLEYVLAIVRALLILAVGVTVTIVIWAVAEKRMYMSNDVGIMVFRVLVAVVSAIVALRCIFGVLDREHNEHLLPQFFYEDNDFSEIDYTVAVAGALIILVITLAAIAIAWSVVDEHFYEDIEIIAVRILTAVVICFIGFHFIFKIMDEAPALVAFYEALKETVGTALALLIILLIGGGVSWFIIIII